MDDLRKLAEATHRTNINWWRAKYLVENYSLAPRDAAYIAACSPDRILKLLDVVDAAQTYYERYAQDEAADGEYSCADKGGQMTGCSAQQGKDALALRVALAALAEVK